MATLAKLLQVDMGLPDMAKRLAAAGRGKDSILAHINPKEAKLLKKHGGKGSINPNTGIMEFYDEDAPFSTPDYTPYTPQETQAEPTPAPAAVETAPAAVETAPVENVTAPAYPSGAFGNAQEQAQAQSPKPNVTAAAYPSGVFGGAPLPILPQQPQAQPQAQPKTPQPGFFDKLGEYSKKAEDLNKILSPFAPYAKFGGQLIAGAKGLQASEEAQKQAAVNEQEIKKLAEPYRQQAAQIAQQGQQMLTMGQQGQLTADQQQKLETLRAQAQQQQAQAGITGGTASQQSEAQIQRVAQEYAQNNISQGLALINQAQAISGTADKLIQNAISTGYSQSADASKLANEFYQALGFSLPETQSKGPAQAGGQA
jgi:hypothetical protein